MTNAWMIKNSLFCGWRRQIFEQSTSSTEQFLNMSKLDSFSPNTFVLSSTWFLIHWSIVIYCIKRTVLLLLKSTHRGFALDCRAFLRHELVTVWHLSGDKIDLWITGSSFEWVFRSVWFQGTSVGISDIWIWLVRPWYGNRSSFHGFRMCFWEDI